MSIEHVIDSEDYAAALADDAPEDRKRSGWFKRMLAGITAAAVIWTATLSSHGTDYSNSRDASVMDAPVAAEMADAGTIDSPAPDATTIHDTILPDTKTTPTVYTEEKKTEETPLEGKCSEMRVGFEYDSTKFTDKNFEDDVKRFIADAVDKGYNTVLLHTKSSIESQKNIREYGHPVNDKTRKKDPHNFDLSDERAERLFDIADVLNGKNGWNLNIKYAGLGETDVLSTGPDKTLEVELAPNRMGVLTAAYITDDKKIETLFSDPDDNANIASRLRKHSPGESYAFTCNAEPAPKVAEPVVAETIEEKAAATEPETYNNTGNLTATQPETYKKTEKQEEAKAAKPKEPKTAIKPKKKEPKVKAPLARLPDEYIIRGKGRSGTDGQTYRTPERTESIDGLCQTIPQYMEKGVCPEKTPEEETKGTGQPAVEAPVIEVPLSFDERIDKISKSVDHFASRVRFYEDLVTDIELDCVEKGIVGSYLCERNEYKSNCEDGNPLQAAKRGEPNACQAATASASYGIDHKLKQLMELYVDRVAEISREAQENAALAGYSTQISGIESKFGKAVGDANGLKVPEYKQ